MKARIAIIYIQGISSVYISSVNNCLIKITQLNLQVRDRNEIKISKHI